LKKADIVAPHRPSNFKELLVYYHLDKWPKLKDFDEFLSCLEKIFKVVAPVWTPMVPGGTTWKTWRQEARKKPALTGKTDLGMASAKRDILVYCSL